MLIFCPLVTAIGEFQTSKISKNPKVNRYFTVFWVNMVTFLGFGSYCLLKGEKLPQTAFGWLLITVLLGVSALLAMVLKIVAFKNDRITRVYPIFYMESVFCLFFDIFLFKQEFLQMQMAGILLVFSMFFVKLFVAYYKPEKE